MKTSKTKEKTNLTQQTTTTTKKRISVWDASMKFQGTGRIVDMRAVMK